MTAERSTSRTVFDTVRTVLAIREYQDRTVTAEIVERIVEAGRLDRQLKEPPALALRGGA